MILTWESNVYITEKFKDINVTMRNLVQKMEISIITTVFKAANSFNGDPPRTTSGPSPPLFSARDAEVLLPEGFQKSFLYQLDSQ